MHQPISTHHHTQHYHPALPPKDAGFSLIECMIVIALIAIIVMLTGMSNSLLHQICVRGQLEKLYTFCHYARRYAIATNKPQTITFDTAHNSYSFLTYHEQLPGGVRFGFLHGTAGPPADPKITLSSPVSFKGNHITIHPDGIMQSGTIYLIDDNKTCMYALSNAVSQISYLRKYRYDGAWHLMK